MKTAARLAIGIALLFAALARAEAPGDARAVARFEGGEVLVSEVNARYAEMLAYGGLFSEIGLDDDPALERRAKEAIARELAQEKVIARRLALENVCLLTQAAAARARENAARAYANLLLEGANADPGALEDLYLEKARSEARVAYMAGEVRVTREALAEAYAALVEYGRARYAENGAAYAYDALYGASPIAWRPEGYRLVQALLVPCGANAAREAAAVRARALAGEDFARLMDAYPAGALLGVSGRAEFYAARGALEYSPEIENAAMALENPGDISQPLPAEGGYLLLRYARDAQGGPVPMEEIQTALTAYAREALLQAQYEETRAQWMEDAHVTYDMDLLS